jgi:hypothetical protein
LTTTQYSLPPQVQKRVQPYQETLERLRADYQRRLEAQESVSKGEHLVSQRTLPGGTYASTYRLRITPFGETYYRREWARYRALYPEVDAPEPSAPERENTP